VRSSRSHQGLGFGSESMYTRTGRSFSTLSWRMQSRRGPTATGRRRTYALCLGRFRRLLPSWRQQQGQRLRLVHHDHSLAPRDRRDQPLPSNQISSASEVPPSHPPLARHASTSHLLGRYHDQDLVIGWRKGARASIGKDAGGPSTLGLGYGLLCGFSVSGLGFKRPYGKIVGVVIWSDRPAVYVRTSGLNQGVS
jgi:hypothetical protein